MYNYSEYINYIKTILYIQTSSIYKRHIESPNTTLVMELYFCKLVLNCPGNMF